MPTPESSNMTWNAARPAEEATSSSRRDEAEPAESIEALQKQLRIERQLNNKLACKVHLLSAMVAMKDEMIRNTDERFAALKWEMIHNFHGDEHKLAAMAEKLRQTVHGWPANELDNATLTIAPLVVKRKQLLEARLDTSSRMSSDAFSSVLADCLPELRRDYVVRVVANFSRGMPLVAAGEFMRHCEDAFVETMHALTVPRPAAIESGNRLDRAAGAVLDPQIDVLESQLPAAPSSESVHEATLSPPIPEAPPPQRQPPGESVAGSPAGALIADTLLKTAPPKRRSLWWRRKKSAIA